MLRRWCLAAATALVAASGCDHHDTADTVVPEPVEQARGLSPEATRLLARVPADTPYVWLNAEPLPAAYVERITPLIDATLGAWGRALDQSRRSHDRETAALAEALHGKMTAKGLEQLGFETNPRMVIYGLGLAPVMRLQLRDGDAVARLLERVDAADGEIDVRTIDGHPVWTAGSPRHPLGAAVAVVDDELVLAVYPPEVEDPLLQRAVGSALPRTSLAHTDWLRGARRDHGLLHHGVGMVEMQRMFAILAGEGDSLTQAVTRHWGAELDDDGACSDGLRSWIAQAPRVWFGLRDIDARGVDTVAIWELDRGLRDDLRRIAAPIAGIGRSVRDEGLASAAIGIDVEVAFATLERWQRDDRLAACGWADDDDDDDPLPPWLAGVHGGSAVLHDWDPRRDRASGVMVLGVEDPLAWLRVVAPGVDTDPLRRSGRAVALGKIMDASGESWLRESWIARGRHALGLAAGEGARKDLRRAVGRDRDDGRTLMSWSVDVRGLVDAVGRDEVRDALGGRDEHERAAAEAILDAVRRVEGALAVGDRGLEFTSAFGL